jgi:CheY-like chemotaxis protein
VIYKTSKNLQHILDLSFKIEILPHKFPPNNLPTLSNSKFILIGEDDVDDQDFLKEIFSQVDDTFPLMFVQNGKQVVDFLEQQYDNDLPCLILLDYNMPELNGADILIQLKTKDRYHSIPKIIWSTSGSNTYKKSCLELGANDYFIKPSNVNELIDLVRKMVSICTN